MCESPPSPRANFTVTSLPNGDMVLFGGEYFDGLDTKCFNELFRSVSSPSVVQEVSVELVTAHVSPVGELGMPFVLSTTTMSTCYRDFAAKNNNGFDCKCNASFGSGILDVHTLSWLAFVQQCSNLCRSLRDIFTEFIYRDIAW